MTRFKNKIGKKYSKPDKPLSQRNMRILSKLMYNSQVIANTPSDFIIKCDQCNKLIFVADSTNHKIEGC